MPKNSIVWGFRTGFRGKQILQVYTERIEHIDAQCTELARGTWKDATQHEAEQILKEVHNELA